MDSFIERCPICGQSEFKNPIDFKVHMDRHGTVDIANAMEAVARKVNNATQVGITAVRLTEIALSSGTGIKVVVNKYFKILKILKERKE